MIQNHRKAKLPQINLQQNTNVVLVLFLCDICSARDLEVSVRDSLSSTTIFEWHFAVRPSGYLSGVRVASRLLPQLSCRNKKLIESEKHT